MLAELRLKEFAGQYADVVITKCNDGSVIVRFESRESFGYPSVEERDLEVLIRKCKEMRAG